MTTNLQLEEIELNDNIKTTFIRKLNDNQAKIDSAYGYLKDNLIQATGEHDLASAVEDYKNDFANIVGAYQERVQELESIGTASASDIKNGKTALVQGQTITGTAFGTTTTATTNDIMNGKTAYNNNGTLLTGIYTPPIVTSVNVTLTGSNTSYITNYGGAINNGTLVLYADSNSASYEHIYFKAISIVGTKGAGWDITNFNTSDPANVIHACTITGLGTTYNTLNVDMNASARNSTYDYIEIDVTITAS